MATERPAGTRRLAGLDGVAVKPAAHDLARAAALDAPRLIVDYEGREHVPDRETLASLADATDLRVTVPVRADGFDPLGDDALARDLPEAAGRVVVAGNPAYLSAEERERPVAPRLGAAVEAHPDAWVGTEGVERLALATGATQFELLSRSTGHDLESLRAAGYDGAVAVYAPVVLSSDTDAILDALGDYAARRAPVADALPEGAPTDASATGRARVVLLSGCREYGLVGDRETVRERAAGLRTAGADVVVGYPPRGLDAL
ncbi:MAG: luciferase [Halobacteriaceae archaeon]